jgi:hypothetical protein
LSKKQLRTEAQNLKQKRRTKMNEEKTYWNDQGRLQDNIKELQELIPVAGKCEKPMSVNKHLDRLRRAVNHYYDLYNNGLWNRRNTFQTLFGISPADLLNSNGYFWNEEHGTEFMEMKMDKFIRDAYIEQFNLGNLEGEVK